MYESVRFPKSLIMATPSPPEEVEDSLLTSSTTQDESPPEGASTNTVNQRLLQELDEISDKQRNGPRSSLTKKIGFVRPQKTDAERQAAIEEARNLNGVNPLVPLLGGAVALALAYGLWQATQQTAGYLGGQVVPDNYVAQRASLVGRNVVIGLLALASGFFGVTGLGILLLGLRVSLGVASGELDPTPLPTKSKIPDNVWDLMLNKNVRGRRPKK